MPIRPNFLERLILYRLNRGPAPMLDLFGAAGFEDITRTSVGPVAGNALLEATKPTE